MYFGDWFADFFGFYFGDGGSVIPAPDPDFREVFYAPARRTTFHAVRGLTVPFLRDPFVKEPGESVKVKLSFQDELSMYWEPNEEVVLLEKARPTTPTGFAYQIVVAGTTGGFEPRWPLKLGATVTDGSATWQAIVAGANGVIPIASVIGSVEDAALTIQSIAINESTAIVVTYGGGGTTDVDIGAKFTLTLGDGQIRVASQVVQIRAE